MKHSSSTAGFAQSISPSCFFMIVVWVAASWSWGVYTAVPCAMASRVFTQSSAPASARRPKSVPPVSPSFKGTSVFRIISPVSRPSSMRMVVTPVTGSPLITAHWMGAAPRYLGSREAWTLMQPFGGSSKISFGRIWPKATTTIISGLYPLKYSIHSGSRTLRGW